MKKQDPLVKVLRHLDAPLLDLVICLEERCNGTQPPELAPEAQAEFDNLVNEVLKQ